MKQGGTGVTSILRAQNRARLSRHEPASRLRFSKIRGLALHKWPVALAPLTLTACAVAQQPNLERVTTAPAPSPSPTPVSNLEMGFGLEEFPPPDGAVAALHAGVPTTGEIVSSHGGNFRFISTQYFCTIKGNVDRRAIQRTDLGDLDLSHRAFFENPPMLVRSISGADCLSRDNTFVYISFNARLNAQGRPYVQQLFAWQYTDGVPTSWWVASVSREEMTNIEEKFRYRPPGDGEYNDLSDRTRLYREFMTFLREHFQG